MFLIPSPAIFTILTFLLFLFSLYLSVLLVRIDNVCCIHLPKFCLILLKFIVGDLPLHCLLNHERERWTSSTRQCVCYLLFAGNLDQSFQTHKLLANRHTNYQQNYHTMPQSIRCSSQYVRASKTHET